MEDRIILYQEDDRNVNVNVNVYYKDETYWFTQKSMAELFDVNVPTISRHLQNIFDEKELDKNATVSKNEIVQFDKHIKKLQQ